MKADPKSLHPPSSLAVLNLVVSEPRRAGRQLRLHSQHFVVFLVPGSAALFPAPWVDRRLPTATESDLLVASNDTIFVSHDFSLSSLHGANRRNLTISVSQDGTKSWRHDSRHSGRAFSEASILEPVVARHSGSQTRSLCMRACHSRLTCSARRMSRSSVRREKIFHVSSSLFITSSIDIACRARRRGLSTDARRPSRSRAQRLRSCGKRTGVSFTDEA